MYGPYIKRANVAYKRHDDVIKELESLTGQRELRTNDYHHDLQRAITKTTELLEDSKDILDLNSFIINQRKESIPISPTEELFFNFNNADDENLMQTLWVNGNTYLITFLRENDTKLYKVNFEWKNPPKYWKYDFRIRLYYKDAEGIYIELTKDSVFISLTNRVATLETIDPSDLLLPSKSSGYVSPIKKLSNQPNEEFKNGNTLNAKKCKNELNYIKNSFSYIFCEFGM